MRTVITIPKELSLRLEVARKRLALSRAQAIQSALEYWLKEQQFLLSVAEINSTVAGLGRHATLDPVFRQAGIEVLESNDW